MFLDAESKGGPVSERICRRFALNFAELNAKGLTLWSFKAFWRKQHVAIDSVVLPFGVS